PGVSFIWLSAEREEEQLAGAQVELVEALVVPGVANERDAERRLVVLLAFIHREPRRFDPVDERVHAGGLAAIPRRLRSQDLRFSVREDLPHNRPERAVALLPLEERRDGPRSDRGLPQRPPKGERTGDHRAGSSRKASVACWVAVA